MKKFFFLFLILIVFNGKDIFGQYDFGKVFNDSYDKAQQQRLEAERDAARREEARRYQEQQLEEERRRQEQQLEAEKKYQERQLEQEQKAQRQQEEYKIAEVMREITNIENDVFQKIAELDNFDNYDITQKLMDIKSQFQSYSAELKNSHKNSFISISDARDKIFTASKEIFRSKEIVFLSRMEAEKNKLFAYLEAHTLTHKQAERIKKKYNAFLLEPFKTGTNGNYIGFNFSPK